MLAKGLPAEKMAAVVVERGNSVGAGLGAVHGTARRLMLERVGSCLASQGSVRGSCKGKRDRWSPKCNLRIDVLSVGHGVARDARSALGASIVGRWFGDEKKEGGAERGRLRLVSENGDAIKRTC